MAFLRSVDEQKLEGVGLAFTLTLGSCPPTPAAWSSCIDRWTKRQRRGGLHVLHWVMEFQRRGVPHLHAAAWYLPDQLKPASVKHEQRAAGSLHRMNDGEPGHRVAGLHGICDWLEVASEFTPGSRGQQVRPIVGPVGWFQYLAKHCGRGRSHYQRQQAAMPKPWTSAPRAWGKSGPWPLQPARELVMGTESFFRYRRLVRAQRVARARRGLPVGGWPEPGPLLRPFRGMLRFNARPVKPKGAPEGAPPLRQKLRNLQHARQMLKCPLPELSAVRGISEWVPERGQADLLRAIGATPADLVNLPEA